MVTGALGYLLSAALPAEARNLALPFDLFGVSALRPHRTVHAAKIPLPRPRPAEAPSAAPKAAAAEAKPSVENKPPAENKPPIENKPPAEDKPAAEKPAEQAAAPAEPQPSACRQALTEEIAIAPSIPTIHGPGGCGGEDLVRLEAIVLPDDRRKVAVKPAAVLRCTMASAIADWVRTDMVPVAARLGSTITDLDNFDSFECRGRNRVAGALLSEHGRANALDVRAFKLANGQSIGLTDRTVPREVREQVLHSACARFTTVLGPGSDWYHEDHIHLDLMQRRNDYRICQWNVWDPLPGIAPLLPAERPEEAPSRAVAAKSDAGKADADGNHEPNAARPNAAQSDKPASAPVPAQSVAKPATKKRRSDRRF